MAKTQCFFLLMTDAIKTELMTLVRVTNEHTTRALRILKSFFSLGGLSFIGLHCFVSGFIAIIEAVLSSEKIVFVQQASPRMDT